MPLDLSNSGPMYLLGRLAALLEGPFPGDQPGDRLSGTDLDKLTMYPRIGLEIARNQFPERSLDDDVLEILNKLPDPLPEGPIPVIDRGPYWLGYYHQRAHDLGEHGGIRFMSAAALRRAGESLFGPVWEGEMAAALKLSDSARLRSWLSPNPRTRRRVPAGVAAEILAMLRQRSLEQRTLADEIERDD